MSARGTATLTLLAAALLAVAIGVDLFWFRPRQQEVERLLARRAEIESGVRAARDAQKEVLELLRYAQEKEEAGRDWVEQYRGQDALSLLERARTAAGLRRTDLILREKGPAGPFVRTRYFLTLEGSWAGQLRFVQTLERSLPLVVIDSFVLEDLPASGATILKLNASVFTLKEEGA